MLFRKFIEKLLFILHPRTHRSDLEQFIVSKNPQTVNEVEQWTREYNRVLTNWSITK